MLFVPSFAFPCSLTLLGITGPHCSGFAAVMTDAGEQTRAELLSWRCLLLHSAVLACVCVALHCLSKCKIVTACLIASSLGIQQTDAYFSASLQALVSPPTVVFG